MGSHNELFKFVEKLQNNEWNLKFTLPYRMKEVTFLDLMIEKLVMVITPNYFRKVKPLTTS